MRWPWRRRVAECGAVSPPLRIGRRYVRLTCCLAAGHPADPKSWEPRLHAAATGERFTTERRVRV